MKNVCKTCHGQVFVDGHYYQFDSNVRLYNSLHSWMDKPTDELRKAIQNGELQKRYERFFTEDKK
jgi:hypothetical protein